LRLRFSIALTNQKFPFADPAALNPITIPPLPEQIELHRDRMWRRDEDLRVERAVDAERFIEGATETGVRPAIFAILRCQDVLNATDSHATFHDKADPVGTRYL
jgi:hypothetical protein